jgi:hypothetical protein
MFQTPQEHKILDKPPFLWKNQKVQRALQFKFWVAKLSKDTIDANSVLRQNDLKPTNICFEKNKSTLVIVDSKMRSERSHLNWGIKYI